jgi:hypothetical protein
MITMMIRTVITAVTPPITAYEYCPYIISFDIDKKNYSH